MSGDGKTEWAAGTGMGEGEGLRDVTEEIEASHGAGRRGALAGDRWIREMQGIFLRIRSFFLIFWGCLCFPLTWHFFLLGS